MAVCRDGWMDSKAIIGMESWYTAMRESQYLIAPYHWDRDKWFHPGEGVPCHMRGSLHILNQLGGYSRMCQYGLGPSNWMDQVFRRFLKRHRVTCIEPVEWKALLRRYHNRLERFEKKHEAHYRGGWYKRLNTDLVPELGPFATAMPVIVAGECVEVEIAKMDTLRQLDKLRVALDEQ